MAVEMEDKRDEMAEKFREVVRQWLDPVNYPHVTCQDVFDARVDAIIHVNQLVREGVVTTEEIQARQLDKPQEPRNLIPA